jgi:hypothetical protein
MKEIEKILRMNAFIQRGLGKLYLDGKEVISVSLDRSWASEEDYDPQRLLTDAQLDDLLGQTFGKPPATQAPETPAERLARFFHETYERLAPEYNYETRKASAVPWQLVPENNKRLMIAVAGEVLEHWQETPTNQ